MVSSGDGKSVTMTSQTVYDRGRQGMTGGRQGEGIGRYSHISYDLTLISCTIVLLMEKPLVLVKGAKKISSISFTFPHEYEISIFE